MFFLLSKTVGMLTMPSNILAGLVLAAGICQLLRWRRLAGGLSLAAAALLILIGVMPLQNWLLRVLENQYPRPDWPAHVDGVLTLSGGLNAALLHARAVPGEESSEARLVSTYELARRYPSARIVFSGGSPFIKGSLSEADAAQYIFAQMGLAPERLTLERRSRNTQENILFSRRLAHPAPGSVWLLATSASHMPRAMAVAHRLGWKVLPWPTDYITQPSDVTGWFEILNNIRRMDYAAHEWIGFLAYRLTGKA